MLFGRKKGSTAQSSSVGPDPWDDVTCGKLAEGDSFDVRITQVIRTVTSGVYREGDLGGNGVSLEAHGIISWPKYIACHVAFENGRDLGCFSYNSIDRVGGRPADPKVPLMQLSLTDQFATEIYEAHWGALMSGRRFSQIRVWKRKGEGLMTELDKEHGYSYQSRYTVIGITSWCQLMARDVPAWALPIDHENFSIGDLPESTRFDLYE